MASTTGSYLVKQGYAIVNNAYKDAIGEANANAIDTTDWVSMGKNLSDFNLLDKFYGSLTNRIAKTIEYVLKYKADGRQILRDSVTYGAFIQKVYVDGFDFVSTPAYTVEPDASTRQIATPPNPWGVTQTFSHTVKIFGGSQTYSLEFTQSELLLRKAVTSESEIMALVDSEFSFAKTKMEIAKEELVNDAIATAMLNATKGGCGKNLYQRFIDSGHSLESGVTNPLDSPAFLKWANMEMNKDLALMKKPSKKYNPEKYLNACTDPICEVLLDWAQTSSVMLESGTYHDDKVALSPKYGEINYWQINGDGFNDFSKIAIANTDLFNNGQTPATATSVKGNGIIAIARDRDAVACNFNNDYSWSYPNPRARLMSYGYDFERGYAVDGHANFLVYSINGIDKTDVASGDTAVISGDVIVGNEITVTCTGESKLYWKDDSGMDYTEVTLTSHVGKILLTSLIGSLHLKTT